MFFTEGKSKMSKLSKHYPKILLAIYIVLFAYFAYKPDYFPIWVTENTIAVVTVIALLILYWRGIRFSNLAYSLMMIALILQTIGGHYCFCGVPFDFVTDLFGFKRNNFDRVGHFAVGFFAIALMEYCESREQIRSRWLNALLAVMAIFGVAGIFEVIEWLYAEITASPEGYTKAGAEFLGSQGDYWDAQKDIICDGLGAIFTVMIYYIRYWKKNVAEIIGYKK